MNIQKQVLATLKGCYSCNSIELDGRTNILLASEGENACLAWSAPDYKQSHTVWEGPGGTMSIVPIPGTNGEFLAVQKFFRMFDWEEAKVVHVRPQANGGYEVTDILQLPYVHRFDLLTVGGRHYFIGCTLATKKATKEDWSSPGKIWVGEYTGVGPMSITVLKDGLTKNHGYSRLDRGGALSGLVTCEQGAFEVVPPQAPDGEWSVTQFMDWPISDISAIDIDGDGELEFATIEPFHGQYFRVYKKVGGVLTCITDGVGVDQDDGWHSCSPIEKGEHLPALCSARIRCCPVHPAEHRDHRHGCRTSATGRAGHQRLLRRVPRLAERELPHPRG